MNMHEPAKPMLEPETIRRFATEQLGISLVPREVDALTTTLNGLLDEIRQMSPGDRRSVEPESGVVVEEWPS
jgi:hypothetical protein